MKAAPELAGPAEYLRLNVEPYGGIPYGLSKEGFYSGTSQPVNKSLLTLFIIAGRAEQSGHGIPVIVSA